MPEPSQELLIQLLDYDPDTGLFTWKVDRGGRAKAGSSAGYRASGGYIQIRINYTAHLAHRLAWIYVNGEPPHYLIDHRNGIRNDNRISNLRQCNNSQNQFNSGNRGKTNTGIKGISFIDGKGVFRVQIRAHGSKLTKDFSSLEAAEEFSKIARESLHGDFTNHGSSA